MTIIRPETVVRWHRGGFRCYWRWKSRPFGGRPQIDADLGALIRRMRVENLLWDAPRIHGELLQAEHLNAGTARSMLRQFQVSLASRLPLISTSVNPTTAAQQPYTKRPARAPEIAEPVG